MVASRAGAGVVCVAMLSAFSWGCGEQAQLIPSQCMGDCPPCQDDDVCVIAHNPCESKAVCGHRDENLATTLLGCSEAMKYDTPPASDCVCRSGRCLPK
ncbi:MAG: hypothetical protein RBU37_24100 [Myxococcota bacterium]|jgi:hypothetical protein|nr:hypothetical protein [Myxococcota bacterium]